MAVSRDSDALRWLGEAGRDGAPGGMSDEQLMGWFLAGPGPAGSLAFEVLVRRHGPTVLARCRGIVRDEHLADDAFQATFLVLARRAATVRDPDRLAPWLDRVARRVALRARAEASRRRAVEGGRIDLDPTEAPAAAPEVAAEEAATLVRVAVGRLPEPDRRLIQLTYWQGRTYREAAEALRWPIGTVRSRLARARARLRDALARAGQSPGAIFGGVTQRIAAAPPSAALVGRTVRLVAGMTGKEIAEVGAGAVPAAVLTLVKGELAMELLTGKSIAALLVVGGAMTAGTVALAWRDVDAPAAAPTPPAPAPAVPGDREAAARREDWAQRLAGLDGAGWRAAFDLGQELAALPGDEGFAILRANWGKIDKIDARRQLLKAWHLVTPYPLRFRNHPRHLDGLDLGMRDPAPEVREWAIEFLGDIALRDFAKDPAAYDGWHEINRGRSAAEALAQSAAQFVAEANGLDAAEATDRVDWLAGHAGALRGLPGVRGVLIDSGLPDLLGRWAADVRPEATRQAVLALRVLGQFALGEVELRRLVVPALARDRPAAIRGEALGALGGPGNGWAVDLLLDGLRENLGAENAASRETAWAAGRALGAIGDPRAIPTMIAVIEADGTYDTVYGVGYFGLGRITGVAYDESHDGAWWRRWWGENQGKYPEDVQALTIPPLPRRVRPAAPVPEAPNSDVADVPSRDLRAGGDEQKRYFLIGATAGEPPVDGRGLLVVLPGGDGSADFEPFLRRTWKHVLGDRWLVAQAVAPRWRDDPDRVVWPTAGLADPQARFTTEEFVRAIIGDARTRARVDPRRIFLLGWSSGGPPCYATALGPDSGVAGAFIAMSAFQPEALPPLVGARGRAFYLLQSPQDQVTPVRFAEAAERELRAAGARVQLDRYHGGHGWRGDIWAMIRAGIAWLDRPAEAGC